MGTLSVETTNDRTVVVRGSSSAVGQAFDVDLERSPGRFYATASNMPDGTRAEVVSSLDFTALDLRGLHGSGANVHTASGFTLETIIGSDQGDTIAIGAGEVHAGKGNDVIRGGSVSTVPGHGNLHILDGGLGYDDLYGGSGDNVYIVDSRYDRVLEDYGGGRDIVQAFVSYTLPKRVADLELLGTRALDGTGSKFDNIITGNAGSNVLDGRAGHDTLVGGHGRDVLTGGDGIDIFKFTSAADFASVKGDRCDLITDFTAGETIDVSSLNAAGFNGGFRFIGGRAFDGGSGELHVFTHAGDTFVQGDVNGDTIVDFELRLTGIHLLTAADFAL